jgi:hypothetical protein
LLPRARCGLECTGVRVFGVLIFVFARCGLFLCACCRASLAGTSPSPRNSCAASLTVSCPSQSGGPLGCSRAGAGSTTPFTSGLVVHADLALEPWAWMTSAVMVDGCQWLGLPLVCDLRTSPCTTLAFPGCAVGGWWSRPTLVGKMPPQPWDVRVSIFAKNLPTFWPVATLVLSLHSHA